MTKRVILPPPPIDAWPPPAPEVGESPVWGSRPVPTQINWARGSR